MGWLGRLLGISRPKLPAGARAFADDLFAGQTFCVRYATKDELDAGARGARIGPTFTTATGADMYAQWVNGDGPLDWDVNGPGRPV